MKRVSRVTHSRPVRVLPTPDARQCAKDEPPAGAAPLSDADRKLAAMFAGPLEGDRKAPRAPGHWR